MISLPFHFLSFAGFPHATPVLPETQIRSTVSPNWTPVLQTPTNWTPAFTTTTSHFLWTITLIPPTTVTCQLKQTKENYNYEILF